MSKLSDEQIEDIVHRRAPAPVGYRYLTAQRQVDYLTRRIAQMRDVIEPAKIVECEVVAVDANGQSKIDKDGFPVSRTLKRYARDLVGEGKHGELELLEHARADWRALLQFSQEEHERRHSDEEYAITREFGPPEKRSGKGPDIAEFVRDYRAKRAERDRRDRRDRAAGAA
jgi:hypothetical protein